MIFNFKLTINNEQVKPINYPSVNFSAMFNTIDFDLEAHLPSTTSIINEIVENKYVNCVYNLNGNESNFIIDSYRVSESYGSKAISFSGLSRTALIEERFSGFSSDMGTNSVTTILSNINNAIPSVNIINNMVLTSDITTLDASYVDIIRSIEEASQYTAVTSFDGLTLKFIGGLYNTSDFSTFDHEIESISSVVSFDNSFESDSKYNVVEIVSGESAEDVGALILETEKLTDSSYYLYVYSEPLINSFSSFNVSSSDGRIELVNQYEYYSQMSLVDFSNDSASLNYPVASILETTFYNKPNTLQYTVGSREIGLAVSDDLAVAKISYRTMRNIYLITGITEPIMKIKVEVN